MFIMVILFGGLISKQVNNKQMKDLEKYLNNIGEIGSEARLSAISRLDLGLRSEAASRALNNRYRRKELMEKGIDFQTSCLIVNRENFINISCVSF